MIDPCDLPTACQSNGLSGLGGSFIYECSFLPSPIIIFGTGFYDLTLTRVSTTNQIVTYNVANGNALVVTFRVQQFQPYKFVATSNINTGAGYSANIIQNNDVLVIRKGRLTWRIGTGPRFNSCLILDYTSCTADRVVPVTDLLPFPEIVYTFNFTCAQLPPVSQFDLASYSLQLQYTNRRPDDALEYAISLNTTASNFTQIGSLFYYRPSLFSCGRLVAPPRTEGYIVENSPDSVFVYPRRLGAPFWIISIDNGCNLTVTLYAPLPSRLGSGVPIPQLESTPVGCPTLSGTVLGTQDEHEICESRFVVSYDNRDCPGCDTSKQRLCASWVKQRKEYVFYCTPVASVLRGKGCTLAAKVASLQKKGQDITLVGAATYAMLRLMLSLLFFGVFDVQLLRQRYYSRFLKKLQKSSFCAYYPLFQGSEYWQFFRV